MRLTFFFFFFSKYSKFNVDFSEAIKKLEKILVIQISAFELVAVNSPDSNENSCKRQSMCQQTVLRLQI